MRRGKEQKTKGLGSMRHGSMSNSCYKLRPFLANLELDPQPFVRFLSGHAGEALQLCEQDPGTDIAWAKEMTRIHEQFLGQVKAFSN